MPDEGLAGANGQRFLPTILGEQLADGLDLGCITGGCSGRMDFQVVEVTRGEAGLIHCSSHGCHLSA